MFEVLRHKPRMPLRRGKVLVLRHPQLRPELAIQRRHLQVCLIRFSVPAGVWHVRCSVPGASGEARCAAIFRVVREVREVLGAAGCTLAKPPRIVPLWRGASGPGWAAFLQHPDRGLDGH